MQTYQCEIYYPPINPSGTEPYYTMSVWHVEACRHTQVRCIPLLIAPSATELYYSMSVWDVEECRNTQVRFPSPTNWTQCYRALLHHVSFTYGTMQAYRGQITPLLIEPCATEPYYTMSVWYVEGCRCTQVRCTPHPGNYYPMSVWYVTACRCTQVRCTSPPNHT